MSDIDILVELDQPAGWEIVDLRDYLQDLLGTRVDLVTTGALRRKPHLWDSVQQDILYA